MQLLHVLITLPHFVQKKFWSKFLLSFFFSFKKKKNLYLFLWWLEFSLKNMEFSIKFVVSLLLNAFMIYGFYSLGGELYFKSKLRVNFFLSWCEIWLVYLWSCSLRYGFLSYWISLWNIGKDLRKTQVEYVTTKFFSNMRNFCSLK